jgi:hypothetical protein
VIGRAIAEAMKKRVVEVWPENWPAWILFDREMRTQWRIGMGGPTGLDYGVLLRFMDRMGLDTDDFEQMLADVRVLEDAALAAIHSDNP